MIINTKEDVVESSLGYEKCRDARLVIAFIDITVPDTGPVYEYIRGMPDNVKIYHYGMLITCKLISYDISNGFMKVHLESRNAQFISIDEVKFPTMDVKKLITPAVDANEIIKKIHHIAYRNEMCGSEIVKLIEEYRNEKS